MTCITRNTGTSLERALLLCLASVDIPAERQRAGIAQLDTGLTRSELTMLRRLAHAQGTTFNDFIRDAIEHEVERLTSEVSA